MSIKLNINGRKLVTPKFMFMHDDELNKFVLAVAAASKAEEEIVKDELWGVSACAKVVGTAMCIETASRLIFFDLKHGFEKMPRDRPFHVAMAFIDEAGEVGTSECRYFEVSMA